MGRLCLFSAALVSTMGRCICPLTLGLIIVTVGLIALVNTNIDNNQKNLGQNDGLILSDGLLEINSDELRWKRSAKESKKSKVSKETKNFNKRTNKTNSKKKVKNKTSSKNRKVKNKTNSNRKIKNKTNSN